MSFPLDWITDQARPFLDLFQDVVRSTTTFDPNPERSPERCARFNILRRYVNQREWREKRSIVNSEAAERAASA